MLYIVFDTFRQQTATKGSQGAKKSPKNKIFRGKFLGGLEPFFQKRFHKPTYLFRLGIDLIAVTDEAVGILIGTVCT